MASEDDPETEFKTAPLIHAKMLDHADQAKSSIRPVARCQNIPNLLWMEAFNAMKTLA